MAQEDMEFNDFYRDKFIPQSCAFNSNLDSTPVYFEALHQDDLSDSIVFLATTNGDTLHHR